ncbi:hypothetical protein [Thermovibrio ammonificans]|uniref:Uncharacterized protein n=1 Tax=Thermovibrio ammonificans (strain DSM 15698 / JCM 12110 / HB-1) TaxID=648996 RepID=E8T5D9_THEA1|nr:hypothetical protein [Thermovibrio ammonificans]ADU97593.1 hypothetical protein Theam_1637 [Thermovibrio ammonificans HB-1]
MHYKLEAQKLLSALRRGEYKWKEIECNNKEIKHLRKALKSHSFCNSICKDTSSITAREKDFCKRILQSEKNGIPLSLKSPKDLDTVVRKVVLSDSLQWAYAKLTNGRKVLYCYCAEKMFGTGHWLLGSCLEDERVKVLTVFFLFPDRKPLKRFLVSRKSKNNTIVKVLAAEMAE